MKKECAILPLLTFSYVPSELKLLIRFHGDFICLMKEGNSGKVFEKFPERYPGFITDMCGGKCAFGMNGCLMPVAGDNLIYRYDIPTFQQIDQDPCSDCHGTGEGEFGGKCHTCWGRGISFRDDIEGGRSFHDAFLTLSILSDLLFRCAFQFSRSECDEGLPAYSAERLDTQQTMMFQMEQDTKQDSAFHGWLHKGIVEACIKFGNSEICEVRSAMEGVEDRLFAQDPAERRYSQFGLLNDRGVCIKVPQSSNHSVLETSPHCDAFNFWKWGNSLCPHNIDGRINQFYLLIGLTMIDTIAKRNLT